MFIKLSTRLWWIEINVSKINVSCGIYFNFEVMILKMNNSIKTVLYPLYNSTLLARVYIYNLNNVVSMLYEFKSTNAWLWFTLADITVFIRDCKSGCQCCWLNSSSQLRWIPLSSSSVGKYLTSMFSLHISVVQHYNVSYVLRNLYLYYY